MCHTRRFPANVPCCMHTVMCCMLYVWRHARSRVRRCCSSQLIGDHPEAAPTQKALGKGPFGAGGFGQSVERGAIPIIFAATSDEMSGTSVRQLDGDVGCRVSGSG